MSPSLISTYNPWTYQVHSYSFQGMCSSGATATATTELKRRRSTMDLAGMAAAGEACGRANSDWVATGVDFSQSMEVYLFKT